MHKNTTVALKTNFLNYVYHVEAVQDDIFAKTVPI